MAKCKQFTIHLFLQTFQLVQLLGGILGGVAFLLVLVTVVCSGEFVNQSPGTRV